MTAVNTRAARIAWIVVLAFLAAAPFLGLYPVFMMKALCFAMFACAFNLLLGFTGLLSFGHAAFMGSAAYATGWFVRDAGLSPELGLLAGVVIAAAIGLAVGVASGYAGGRTDAALMRVCEFFQTIPSFLFAMVLIIVLEPSLTSIVVAIGVTSWPQIARLATFPLGEAREDWKILRALSERLGHTLPYDSVSQLRARMVAVNPVFGKLGTVTPAPWGGFGTAGALDGAAFATPITNYYMTDPISRASETMARCTETFVRGASAAAEERTGTHG